MRKMTFAERRARVGRRHRLAPKDRALDATQAAASVLGLHGTDAASVFLGAWARMANGDIAAVEQALYDERSLLRILAMRRTMFVAPVEIASVMLAACSHDVSVRERRRLIGLLRDAQVGDGDPERWLAVAEQAALDALERHEMATAPELAGDHPHLSAVLVLAPGKNYEAKQRVISRVLSVLGAQGRAIRARPRGSWTSTQFRWAALERWQPAGLPTLGAAEARKDLACRWLHAFGPATLEDLEWWTGWTRRVTREAIAANATVEVDLGDGIVGIALEGDDEPVDATEPWVALLPALDATTMGWKDRRWYLGEHGPLLFDRNGNAGPTLWADGRIVGAWAQAANGELRLRLIEDIGAERLAAIETAAEDLAQRIGDARLTPRARARSPLEQELLA